MNSKLRTIAFVCALVGLAAMAWATYVHHRVLFDPAYASFCDINSTVSCSDVLLSRYASTYGIQMSILGIIFFTGILVLLGASVFGRPSLAENVPGYVFAMSTAGLAVVLYLAYISFAVLKVYCPLCLTADVAVVGLFIVSGAATPFPMTTLPRRLFADLKSSLSSPPAIAVAVLFVAGAVSAVVLSARDTAAGETAAVAQISQAARASQQSEFERWYTAQIPVPLVVPNEGAKVLLVEFSDYQCPYCRQAWQILKPIVEKYNAKQPNTVRLVMKDFPLDSKCNDGVRNGGPHPSACAAAVAVRLARLHGRGEALENWFFSEHQEEMTPENVRTWARDIGQVTDFDAKYASTIEAVKGDIAFGHTLQVNGTPQLFVNGVRLPAGVLPAAYYDQAIALELKRADAQK